MVRAQGIPSSQDWDPVGAKGREGGTSGRWAGDMVVIVLLSTLLASGDGVVRYVKHGKLSQGRRERGNTIFYA